MASYVGQTIGRYHLTRLLDQGENAEVYVGEHQITKQQGAMKIPYRPQTRDSWEQLQTEARLLARFDHPHIVHPFDFGTQSSEREATVYLALEYAPLGTLRKWHPKGTQLPLEQIISYVKQVAAALEYLHDHQVLHRNLKPEHLLVGHRQQLMVCGFGVALEMQHISFQEKQEVVGTLTYRAPEQLHGRPVPASDQYALGSIVYEWLTGEPPFRGPYTMISERILHASPSPLAMKGLPISSAIEHVVMKNLEKMPERRFPNMIAFANALEQGQKIIGKCPGK